MCYLTESAFAYSHIRNSELDMAPGFRRKLHWYMLIFCWQSSPSFPSLPQVYFCFIYLTFSLPLLPLWLILLRWHDWLWCLHTYLLCSLGFLHFSCSPWVQMFNVFHSFSHDVPPRYLGCHHHTFYTLIFLQLGCSYTWLWTRDYTLSSKDPHSGTSWLHVMI